MKTLLLGDICPSKITSPLFAAGEIQTLFTDTAQLFEGNDINFVNLECAITESDEPIKKFGPPLAAPLRTAEILKELGVTHVGLSNNHFFDYGKRGVRDSLRALDAVGIDYTGFGADYEDARKNLVVEKDGERICLIAVCEHEYSYALEDRMGSRPFDAFDTVEDIRRAKENCDRVIVLYHGGKEHCQYPSPRLRQVCRAMAHNGADVVLCQHTHCIGAYEEYEGCHILYGQGNFHFVIAAPAHPETWNNLLAVKYDTVTGKIEFIPIVNTKNGITLAKGEEKKAILAAFAERNEMLADGRWKQGWHDFCESVKPVYLATVAVACAPDATQKDYDKFGHFLDCEAHTDVWRELFPSYNLTNEK